MRVFVTGATGFVGSAVVKELIEAGHQVTGLVRSEAGAKSLMAAGARAHRGTIEDLESLRRGAAAADGVIHTAFFHAFSQASLGTRLQVMLGGSPTSIVSRFMAAAVGADRRAIETLGAALKGPDRTLVAVAPTMALSPGRVAKEEDAADPVSVGGIRAGTETAVLTLASRGVRASVVRLPPSVHDQTKQGLASRIIELARKKQVAAYVGDGKNRWAAVHRLDAARLFRLALENGGPGARYHAVDDEGIAVRDIASVIGRHLNIAVVSKSPKEAAKFFSFYAPFISADNPVSSEWTRTSLGWQPTQPRLMSEIDQLFAGQYLVADLGSKSIAKVR
jgi:nucleoside-diphosphate-sugar epimerase